MVKVVGHYPPVWPFVLSHSVLQPRIIYSYILKVKSKTELVSALITAPSVLIFVAVLIIYILEQPRQTFLQRYLSLKN